MFDADDGEEDSFLMIGWVIPDCSRSRQYESTSKSSALDSRIATSLSSPRQKFSVLLEGEEGWSAPTYHRNPSQIPSQLCLFL